MSAELENIHQLKHLYEDALAKSDIDKIIKYGIAYYTAIGKGVIKGSERDLIQQQVWKIKSKEDI